MRWVAGLVLLCLLLVGPPAIRAQSDEETLEKLRRVEELMRRLKEAEAGADEPGLERLLADEGRRALRIHNVADLTIRLDDFVHPNLHLKPAGAEIDENAPLFGFAQEGERFFASVEEVMDLLMMNIRPEIWDDEGNSMWISGEGSMIVVAPPEVQEEIERYLADLRASLGRLVTVSVRVLRFDGGVLGELVDGNRSALLDPEAGARLIARAEAGKGVHLAHSVRLAGFNGQRVMLYRAAQRAFVQDYDVEVAQESKISDPIVGVVQTGVTFDVRSIMRGEEMVVVDLMGQLSAMDGMPVSETRSGPVQKPAVALAEFAATVTVPVGGYALVSAGGEEASRSWALLVSTAVERIQTAKGGGR